MRIHFKPDKKWWQIWKVDRMLVEGKDYTAEKGVLHLKKKLKGQITTSYELYC